MVPDNVIGGPTGGGFGQFHNYPKPPNRPRKEPDTTEKQPEGDPAVEEVIQETRKSAAGPEGVGGTLDEIA